MTAEWRHDPLTGRFVILAPDRADRAATDTVCPFCEGHEAETPPEIWADRPEGVPDGPGWRVRIVPNRFPMLTGGGFGGLSSGPQHGQPAHGHHEVVVHSPDHQAQIGRSPLESVGRLMRAWRLRHMGLRVEGWACVQTSINHGAAAGASQPHPHSQVVALPFIPQVIGREAEVMGEACLLCRLGQAVDEELVVTETPELVALCPTWSRVGYEMLIAPRRHEVRLEEADDLLLGQTAEILRDSLGRLDQALGDPPFTLVVHTAPRGDPGSFHWHVHVWPRRETPGGFEWGLGLDVLPVSPPEAAARLRAVASAGSGEPS